MSLTQILCKNWPTWKDDPNFAQMGAELGAPPPKKEDQTLLGDTSCMPAEKGKEFDCNIGDVGLYEYDAVRNFQQTMDNRITDNNTSMTAVKPAIGTVIPNSSPTSNICKSSYKKPLEIDFGKVTDLTQAKISALQKTWGNKRGKPKQLINGGVHVDNIYLSEKVQGSLAPQAGQDAPTKFEQTCLRLELHGTEWGDREPHGLTIVTDKESQCPDYRPNSTLDGRKVGACVATEYQLGPGRFEVVAHAPDMAQWSKKQPGGESGEASNGYCWAIWTFHYEEHYQGNNDPQSVSAEGNVGDIQDGYCFNHAVCEGYDNNTYPLACPRDTSETLPGKEKGGPGCYGPASNYADDDHPTCSSIDTSTTIVNHEIDIEIPGSWPGKTANPGLASSLNSAYWTPSTWNCNTFLGENDNVNARALWQSQYIVQKMDISSGTPKIIPNGEPNSFLATPPESQPPNLDKEVLEFHNYRFDWIVPDNEEDPPYVEWFFDGHSIHKSYTMIPTRSSRLVVGGWFPHWTQSGNSNEVKAPDSLVVPWEQANIYVASIKYTPDPIPGVKNKYTDYPQNYDQCGKDGLDPISCGFVVPNMPGETLGNNPRPNDVRVCGVNCPSRSDVDPPKSNNKLILYILIALAAVAAIALVILMAVLFHKK